MIKKFFILFLILCATIFLQLFYGSTTTSFSEIIQFSHLNNFISSAIFFEIRLPAMLAATFGGAALGVSGLLMQSFFRNPVAGPHIMGVSSGAGFGVALSTLLISTFQLSSSFLNEISQLSFAVLGSMIAFLFVLYFSFRIKQISVLLIIGIMIGGTFNALTEIMQSLLSADGLRKFLFWNMGSFKTINLQQSLLLAFITFLFLTLSFGFSKALNLLLIGEENARSLGLSLQRTKLGILIISTLLSATVTTYCGPIAFVGLATPHLSRRIFQTSHHALLLLSCILSGAIICGFANFITSVNFFGFHFPINAITSLFGAPFVVSILMKNKRI